MDCIVATFMLTVRSLVHCVSIGPVRATWEFCKSRKYCNDMLTRNARYDMDKTYIQDHT